MEQLKDRRYKMSNKEVTASQTPEELIASLQAGELGSLMDRVKEAQEKIIELRNQQAAQPAESQKLHPREIAQINSLIIHDLLDIKQHDATDSMTEMIEVVLKAAIKQHGRMLDVEITEDK
jgi:hypothetical protein